MTHPPRSAWLRRLTAALVLCLCAGPAAADAVKLSGFWIENATIQNVTQGQLVYSASTGGQVTKSLSDVEGLRLSAHPEVEQAQAAMASGNAEQAATLLRVAIGKSRQEWTTQYMQRLLIEALNASGGGGGGGGDAVEAARTYAELVRTDPDPFFVPEAPVAAVAGAPEAVKGRVRDTLTPMLARTPERYREGVARLLAAAGSATAVPTTPSPDAPASAPGAATTTAAESAVLLPKWADDGDPVVQMLRRGEFREAIATADQQMSNPDLPLARPLFYKGVGQLALAEQTGDERLYKDAGLNFMRVVTFYDPKTTTVPPAMVEAAYVHQKLGRADIATRLLDGARALMDEEEDPAYYQRLTTLMASE